MMATLGTVLALKMVDGTSMVHLRPFRYLTGRHGSATATPPTGIIPHKEPSSTLTEPTNSTTVQSTLLGATQACLSHQAIPPRTERHHHTGLPDGRAPVCMYSTALALASSDALPRSTMSPGLSPCGIPSWCPWMQPRGSLLVAIAVIGYVERLDKIDERFSPFGLAQIHRYGLDPIGRRHQLSGRLAAIPT